MTTRRYITRVVLIAVLLLGQTTNIALANELNWPQFRGPNSSGLGAEGQNFPVEFGPEQNLLWKTSLRRGHSVEMYDWQRFLDFADYHLKKKK